MFNSWSSGGTDYGGCVGRHFGLYDGSAQPSNTGVVYGADAGGSVTRQLNAPYNNTTWGIPNPSSDPPMKLWGIFGRINVSTSFAEISDGLSNTIATGELQRINAQPIPGTDIVLASAQMSHDGWAVGDSATLFTTDAVRQSISSGGKEIAITQFAEGGLNNCGFPSPGSQHPNGALFGMADGSAKWVENTINADLFALMGSMADNVPTDASRE